MDPFDLSSLLVFVECAIVRENKERTRKESSTEVRWSLIMRSESPTNIALVPPKSRERRTKWVKDDFNSELGSDSHLRETKD